MTPTPGFASKKLVLRFLLDAHVENAHKIVDSIPDADVQQIIHCGECRHSTPSESCDKMLLCKNSMRAVLPHQSCENGKLRDISESNQPLTIERVAEELRRLDWKVTNLDDITGGHSSIQQFLVQRKFSDDVISFCSKGTDNGEYEYGEIIKADTGTELASNLVSKANSFNRRRWVEYNTWITDSSQQEDLIEERADTIASALYALSTAMQTVLMKYGCV